MPYECSILDVLVKVSERDGKRGKEREREGSDWSSGFCDGSLQPSSLEGRSAG